MSYQKMRAGPHVESKMMALLSVFWALLSVLRAVLSVCRALLSVYRALLIRHDEDMSHHVLSKDEHKSTVEQIKLGPT